MYKIEMLLDYMSKYNKINWEIYNLLFKKFKQ